MSQTQEIQNQIERLKRLSIFKEIADNNQAITDLANLMQTRKYSAGEIVIVEKEIDGDSMYIIKSGTVEIIRKTQQGDHYTVTELSSEMNIFFGEVALLDPDERSATVRCKTDCEFDVLERDKFIAYGNKNPEIGLIITRELSKILCKRMRKSNSDIVILFDALVDEVEKSGGLD